ncbi:MAG: tetratricopeptide repeat protein, partial [Flavobacteriales bacterium]
LTTLFALFCTLAFSQVANPEFDKVAKKFEKGSYESALESAESLIDNDKHRKKPEPYLWASMCHYAIHNSDDEKLKSRFKSSLKDALKYAGKAVQKDKNGSIVEDNAEYYTTMKTEGVAYAQEYETDGNYRKALYTYKQILKFDPNDPNILFVKGVTDLKQNAAFEAQKAISRSFPILEKNYRNLDYNPDPISSPLLKPALVYYIDKLIEDAYTDSARNVVLSARVIFPLDEDIKSKLAGLE